MELVNPGFGLIFWMIVSFGIVLIILGKYAWRPILNSLRERERSIDEALLSADKAREEMKELKANNEKLLEQAREEQDKILKNARETSDKIIEDSRNKANEEANRILETAREQIKNERQAAMSELKKQIASISIEIAEKILIKELQSPENQKKHIEELVEKIKIN
ncbi:MAG: F0F1 ATP synthase subunit B [Bacteroidales bacterium]|nr:F0F1 ATP synthase subunit B [Bacteroidales bacterium]